MFSSSARKGWVLKTLSIGSQRPPTLCKTVFSTVFVTAFICDIFNLVNTITTLFTCQHFFEKKFSFFEKILKKVLTTRSFDDIISYILLNAMKELRVFGTAVQRVDGRCKSICYKNSVSFRSRAPQPQGRVRSYGSPVTMATGFIEP